MIDGVLVINKEKDFTSHDVVNIVRGTLKRKYGKVKVGHTGTLDPNAQGVLPICIGKATKLSDKLMASDKIYRAELILGTSTDTQDITGVVLKTKAVDKTKEEIVQAIMSFEGSYDQMPPMFSAIKINGQKLYDLARKGIEVERPSRLVTIHSIKIEQVVDDKTVWIEVHCSKGTYIRTLCHDIGEKLGVGGVMGDLVRTASGDFKIENSIKIDEFRKLVDEDSIAKYLCYSQ